MVYTDIQSEVFSGLRRVRRMGSWVPGTPPFFSLKTQDFASFFENFPGGRPPEPPLKGTGARAWGSCVYKIAYEYNRPLHCS